MKFLVLIFISSVAFAHQHGAAKMDVTIEGNTIKAHLNISGYDLMGFEGAAKTQPNKNSLKSTTSLFSKSYSLFITDEAAGCKVTKRELTKIDPDPYHTDYDYKSEYTCKDATKLTELNVNLFSDLKSLTQLVVNLNSEKLKKEFKLNPKFTVVGLL